MSGSFQASSGWAARHLRGTATVTICGRYAGRILVGTSSWADPGFVKQWYPPTLPAKERLPCYAQRFEGGGAQLELLRHSRPQRGPRLGGLHAGRLRLRREGASRRSPGTRRTIDSLPPRPARRREDERARPGGAHRGARGDARRRIVEASGAAGRGRQAGRLPGALHPGVRARQARPARARQPALDAALATGRGRAAPPRLGLEGPHRRDARPGLPSGGWRSSAWTRRPESTCRSCRR